MTPHSMKWSNQTCSSTDIVKIGQCATANRFRAPLFSKSSKSALDSSVKTCRELSRMTILSIRILAFIICRTSARLADVRSSAFPGAFKNGIPVARSFSIRRVAAPVVPMAVISPAPTIISTLRRLASANAQSKTGSLTVSVRSGRCMSARTATLFLFIFQDLFHSTAIRPPCRVISARYYSPHGTTVSCNGCHPCEKPFSLLKIIAHEISTLIL